MTSVRRQFTLALTALALAACSSGQNKTGILADSSTAAMATAPASFPAPTTTSTGAQATAPAAASRAQRDNSGYARILVERSKPVLVDGIETRVPEDGTITLTNGTHRIQCPPHDIVITVDYQPRSAPATVDCRVP